MATAAIAPSKLRSASVSSGRLTCRRSTASWWRNTMISRSLERPGRTVSRASDARKRYKIRYTRTQHRPPSRDVNDHGRVSGTHRASSVRRRRWLARCAREHDWVLLGGFYLADVAVGRYGLETRPVNTIGSC